MDKNNTNNNLVINNYIFVKLEDLKALIKLNSNIMPFFQTIPQKPGGLNMINEEKTNDIDSPINKDKKEKNDQNNVFCGGINDLTVEINNNETKNIFTISKDNKKYFKLSYKKKTGRKPKNSSNQSFHTKYSYDNILKKIKVKFLSKIIKYINRIIMSNYNSKIQLLKPLQGSVAQNNNINFNKKLLNLKLKEIFTIYEINGKFKLIQKNYNKNVIDRIYKENIKELIDILEMTFLEVFDIFRNSNENQQLNGLEKLDTIINEIELKEEKNDDDYINKFKDVVKDFEKFYFNKVPRNKNKKN